MAWPPGPPPALTDGAVNLRTFTVADVPAVTEACQDPELSRWMATIPFPYTEDDARSWISTHDDLWSRGDAAHFAITTPAGALLGAIGLEPIDMEQRSALVGYWVAAWARRRGVATRALRLVSGWALTAGELEVLDLNTKIGNIASEGVAQKAGFEMIAVVKDFENPWSGEHLQVTRWRRTINI